MLRKKMKENEVNIQLEYGENREGAFSFEFISGDEVPEKEDLVDVLASFNIDWRLIVGRLFAHGYDKIAERSEGYNSSGKDVICWYVKSTLPNNKTIYMKLSHLHGDWRAGVVYGNRLKKSMCARKFVNFLIRKLREKLPVPYTMDMNDYTFGIDYGRDSELMMFYKSVNRKRPVWEGDITVWE